MKRVIKITKYMMPGLAAVLIGAVIAAAVTTSAEADECIAKADAIIEANEITSSYNENYNEPETVSLSYADWQGQQTEPDLYQMDVWQLGSYLYGISELDTTRSLILITVEGYGYSQLSYYVGCCCLTRLTADPYLFGADNLYWSFGGNGSDPSYDIWMDSIEYEDYAVEYLREVYLNPTYVLSCNGMETPENYVYYENGIYVW